jgi:hypothetical protein
MQSAAEAQVSLQAVAPQTNGVHGAVVAAGQLPAPSQNLALVCVPALHDGAPHIAPAGTGEQVPAFGETLQAWQTGQDVAVVLQHTPSTQRPALHWTSAVQAVPMPTVLWQCPVVSQ